MKVYIKIVLQNWLCIQVLKNNVYDYAECLTKCKCKPVKNNGLYISVFVKVLKKRTKEKTTPTLQIRS